jgi:starch synthase
LNNSLKILFAISEFEGLVKTGGLADVGRALPAELKKHGHDIRVVMPYHSDLADKVSITKTINDVYFNVGNFRKGCAIHEAEFKNQRLWFIEHYDYFSRHGLYGYDDDAERYAFFSGAVPELCQVIDFFPDIIHCNDWQTALIPYYLKICAEHNPEYSKIRTILTIHSGAFQGRFHGRHREFSGIAIKDFVPGLFEDNGLVNFLKGGIALADKITTVSPGYAQELMNDVGSHGLHETYISRQKDIEGILNGCDYDEWNPETDPDIPKNYSKHDLSGKLICKTELQQYYNLPERADVPVIGILTRLTKQKGFGYLIDAIKWILEWDLQFVVLGTGEFWIEEAFTNLARDYPDKVGCKIEYNWKLAHLIEAGSDIFLMPSLFEPCGLNQLYSMKYGTLPVVRAVGGLKDTVKHYNEANGTGTGFVFDAPDSQSVYNCIRLAVSTYYDRRNDFKKMIQSAMSENFHWATSATEYEKLYRQISGQPAHIS